MNNKENEFSLNFSRLKLSRIPNEVMKKKDSLIELDFSGNNFADFNSVLEDLKKLKKLKKLKINIYTLEQAKAIIDSMPNLEYLNDEPINDDSEISQEDFSQNKEEEGKEEVIINIPLLQLVDKNFEPIFLKLSEFYNMNKGLEEDFQKIIENFNDLGKKMKINQNENIYNLSINEINKKLELYKFLDYRLNEIKDKIYSKNSLYNKNSIILLFNVMEENEKIKDKCIQILLNYQYESSEKANNGNQNYLFIPIPKNEFSYYNQKNILKKKENIINNNQETNNNKNKLVLNKFSSSSDNHQSPTINMFLSNLTKINKNTNENLWVNRSFNTIKANKKSPKYSDRKSQSPTTYTENKRNQVGTFISKKNVKKYTKQINLIENINDPKITKLLIKSKSNFDNLNIFDDDYNEQIYKDKLNIKIINLNILLEIINQIYKIRNSRIEKQKQGVYNKATLEQDLYTYLKSKYGLKKLIIEWSINILSSIQSYVKINAEVYLFSLILKNELDEDAIEFLIKLKKTVNSILNLIYDYDYDLIEKIKQNKEFLRENEWKTISKCLYCDDTKLKEKFINKVSNFIDKLVKGKDLIIQTGKNILFDDYMNILISFNLKLRKKYLHNLFLLFVKEDKKRTGIINYQNFKNIIKNSGIFDDKQKIEEFSNELIEIADKEGSGQITFSDIVQCLDNLDLILDEGKVKFLDKLSEMSFQE